MPIKPENRARYPKNWPEIRAVILNRSSNRCEKCKAPNRTRIARGGGKDFGTYMLDSADVFCATLPARLRQAAQYTGLDGLRELLIEAAGALDGAEPVEMHAEFTDTARAALLWVLYHHQGGSSKVGQPIRYALGMGAHERLNDHQLREAKRWGELEEKAAAQQPQERKPLPKTQLANLWVKTYVRHYVDGPVFYQVARAVERAHGIKE